jgi:hypothetical protein
MHIEWHLIQHHIQVAIIVIFDQQWIHVSWLNARQKLTQSGKQIDNEKTHSNCLQETSCQQWLPFSSDKASPPSFMLQSLEKASSTVGGLQRESTGCHEPLESKKQGKAKLHELVKKCVCNKNVLTVGLIRNLSMHKKNFKDTGLYTIVTPSTSPHPTPLERRYEGSSL